MNEKNEGLCRAIGYEFRNGELLENALTHSSYAHEHGLPYRANNERLEFLGDAFFDAVIAEELYKKLQNQEEGDLSKLRASIVCEESLIRKAEEIGLSGYVLLGNGEARNARNFGYKAFEADALEAIFGAVFLDGGYEPVRAVILGLFSDIIDEAVHGKLSRDYKSMLQEKMQALGHMQLAYEITGESGPDHDKTFRAVVKSHGKIIGTGTGKSKKHAEQNAAKQALEGARGR